MLTRRELLRAASSGTVLLVLVPVVGGSSSSESTPSSTGTRSRSERAAGGCDGVSTDSSLAAGHFHSLCVRAADLTSPPPGGIIYMTSSASGHVHQVTLSPTMLQAIQNNQTVAVETTNVLHHTHTFAIRKAATSPTATATGGGGGGS